MTETTQHTPADVRERVAFEAFAWEHGRRGAAAEWIRAQWQGETPKWRAMYFDLADRILALLLRTPRGEGEAWRAFLDALDEYEAAANLWADPEGPTAEDMARLDRARQRVIECARVLAALRSEAQGEEDAVRRTWELAVRRAYGCLDYRGGYRGAELGAFHAGIKTVIRALEAGPDAADTQAAALDRIGAALRSEANGKEADALDMIRWAESQGAVLEPVAGNLTPPGTYACYVEGVGDDPAEYEDAGEPYMGPGILGAIRAARRGGGTWTWSKGRWGMTPQELLALCAESERDGVDYIVLKVATRREPGNRMRILPGVMAEVLDTGRGYAVVRAPARKVREVVERALTTHSTDRSESDDA